MDMLTSNENNSNFYTETFRVQKREENSHTNVLMNKSIFDLNRRIIFALYTLRNFEISKGEFSKRRLGN